MLIRRALLIALLVLPAARTGATDYTDIWYLPAESGWGVNVVQSDNFLFITFFVYGSDGKPTWYVAQVTQDASGNFNGTLYSATGTYFAAPWVGDVVSVAGTASFRPTNPSTATLVYTAIGAPTVTKSIQRQTLTSVALGASYTGGQAGQYSGCTDPAQNFLYKDTFDLQVTQQTDNSVTFAFTYPGLHALGQSRPTWQVVQRARGDLCLLQRPQHRGEHVRDPGNRARHRGPLLGALGRRELQRGCIFLRGAPLGHTLRLHLRDGARLRCHPAAGRTRTGRPPPRRLRSRTRILRASVW